jgi:AcrR family transcriptional regulator
MTATSVKPASDVARHIARVAARLFASQGYDATSVREIVEAAGVTKPTLYYHFGSKEGLAQALLTDPMTELIATLRMIVAEDGDPVDILVKTLEARFAFCREDPDRARFVYALWFGPLNTSLAGELDRFIREIEPVVGEAIGRLVAAGILDPTRVESFTMACQGMVCVSTLAFLYRDHELGPGLAQQVVDDLLRGFGNPAGPLGRA